MNVLKISTTPIALSMTSQRARLECEIPNSQVGIVSQPGRLQMRSEHIKVNIDTFDARQSIGCGAGEAAARYAEMGNQLAQIQNGIKPTDVVRQCTMPEPVIDTFEADYVPGKLEINIEQYPKVEIEYVADPLYVPPRANPNYEE